MNSDLHAASFLFAFQVMSSVLRIEGIVIDDFNSLTNKVMGKRRRSVMHTLGHVYCLVKYKFYYV